MDNLQKFIKDYFRLLNLRDMPEAVFGRYEKYIKDNDFPNKDVKSWKDFIDPTTNTWQDLPDFSALSDDDLNLLYLDFLRTFSTISSHVSEMDDDTKNLISTYYGSGKLFDVPPISNTMKQQINDLINVILTNSSVASFADIQWGEDEILNEIVHGLKKPESDDARRLIFKIVDNLQKALNNQQYQQTLSPVLSTFDLAAIHQAIKPFGLADITPQNRTDLKSKAGKIFETLFKKNKTRDAFKKYEPGEKFVSEQIEAALSNTDYTGKINEKNYVPADYKDDLNFRQTVEKKLNDTYNDVLKKYLNLHRANLFIKPQAKAIFDALDKEKLKPTDGIAKILEKAGDVAKSLKGKQPFDAADHFKWMTEKLSDYKDHGMGKAIEGALRNGHQMKHIIEQLILDAVKEGKVKEAKTTMEVLSVMQYGLFTSRTMDAINKTDMTIFSDGKLSWNKNEGIKMVTSAFDKTIKFGIQGIGYAATAATNKIRRMGRTFDHSGKINEKSELRKTELAQQKTDFDSEKIRKDAAFDAEIRTNEATRTATGITDLNASKNNLANGEALEARRKQILDGRKANFDALEEIENDYNYWQNLETEKARIQNETQLLMNDLAAMPDPAANQLEILIAETKRREINKRRQQIQKIDNSINTVNAQYIAAGLTLDAEHNRIHTITPPATQSPYDLARMKRDNAQTAYDAQHDANEDLRNKINEYETATENIDTAQRQKQELQKAADEWDDKNKNDYLALMAHWDFLQSGNA